MQEVLSGGGKRRRIDEHAASITALPADIIINGLCPFLAWGDLSVFLGMTCRRLRVAYYKPSVFFTDARPLRLPINADMKGTLMGPGLLGLWENASAEAGKTPVHLYLGEKVSWGPKYSPNDSGLKIHPRATWIELSVDEGLVLRTNPSSAGIRWSFAIRELVVRYGNALALYPFFYRNAAGRAIDSLRVISDGDCFGWSGLLPLPLHDMPEPGIRTLHLGLPVASHVLSEYIHTFEKAMVYIDRMDMTSCNIQYYTDKGVDQYTYLLDSVEIATMIVNAPRRGNSERFYQRCMQRTTGRFVVTRTGVPDWASLLVAELERRREEGRPWHLCFSNTVPQDGLDRRDWPLLHAISKYVTEMEWRVLDGIWYIDLDWDALASVRRFTITVPSHQPGLTFTVPKDDKKLICYTRPTSFTVEARKPGTFLRPADMRYLYTALSCLKSNHFYETAYRGDISVLKFCIRRCQKKQLKGYDYAFRISYTFNPTEANSRPISGDI